jgi:hypothetical protein
MEIFMLHIIIGRYSLEILTDGDFINKLDSKITTEFLEIENGNILLYNVFQCSQGKYYPDYKHISRYDLYNPINL